MNRVNLIFGHKLYIFNVQKNTEIERDWVYCKHDIVHFMDVARIAYILNLEREFGLCKELIYAAAILHDITKWRQITNDEPHNETALEPAEIILTDCNFAPAEIKLILNAILHHRKGTGADPLAQIIFEADKLSRACCCCTFDKATCNWDLKQKSQQIKY